MEAANQDAAYTSKLDLTSQSDGSFYSGRSSLEYLINTRYRSKDLERDFL